MLNIKLFLILFFIFCVQLDVYAEEKDEYNFPDAGYGAGDSNTLITQTLLKESDSAFKNNDIKRSVALLEKIIALDPHFAQAYYRLGVIYMQKKEFDKAIGYFKKAVDSKPDFTPAYINLGSLYGELKRYNEAVDSYMKALQLDKANPKIYYNIGVVFWASGDAEQANNYFNQAKKLSLSQGNKALTEKIDKLYKNNGEK